MPYSFSIKYNKRKDDFINELYTKIEANNSRSSKYAKVISVINKEILLLTNKSIKHNYIVSKILNLPKNKDIIIYDRSGLVFDKILRYINGFYDLRKLKLYVVSDYFYPKYVSSSLSPNRSGSSDFYIIDASKFINKKIIKSDINKIKFLLQVRDDFTSELSSITAENDCFKKLLCLYMQYIQ